MKKKHLLMCISIIFLQGCNNFSLSQAPTLKENIKYDFLSNNPTEGLWISNGYKNGSPFNVFWSDDNIIFDENGMNVSLTENDNKYYGGEIRTFEQVHYGFYSTIMKPVKCVGTVSSFFTYTGPSEGNQHDEIDIEFLGKDTTKVQFNYYKDGVGGHEFLYDLGFDAYEEFHQYGFYWGEDKIIWYVDYKPVYYVNDTVITPGKLFANVWGGDKTDLALNWLGEYVGPNDTSTAIYKYFSYVAI